MRECNTITTYYEIENTINEWRSAVSARWTTLELAKADMINHEDWYGLKGTGTIYEVNVMRSHDGKIKICKREVYRKR